MNQLQAWSLWKNLIFLSRMTYGRVSAGGRVFIAARHQVACMNRLRAFKQLSGIRWISSGSVLWNLQTTGWCTLEIGRHWLGSPDAAEIRLGYSPVAKRNGTKLFSLIPLSGIQYFYWCFNPVKLLAPNFLDFKFIFLVCIGSKCREQHRERIGAAYLPSK